MADSLNAFAVAASVELSVDSALTRGKTSDGLQGAFTIEQGFAALLAPHALQVVRGENGAYSLRPAPPKVEGATVLPVVIVTANQQAEPHQYRVESSSVALFSETPLLEVPFSVGIYNETLIEDQRAFTLREVLQNDPSVAIQMPGGFYGTQNFSSRGFRVDNFNGYRLDGLPVIHTVESSIDDKSRVELLKGPAALRFGFMAPGGAINLVRKRPTPEFSTSLQFDADTFSNLYSQIDVSDTVLDETLGYRLVLAGDDFDSFYDHAGGDRMTGSLYTEWKPSERVMLWTSVGAQDLERSGYYGPMITANGQILDTGVKTNIMQGWARNRHETLDAAIGSDVVINQDWKLRASFNHQDADRESRLSYPYSVEDNGDYTEGALITNGPFKWETQGGHLHLEGGFATGSLRHDVVVGAQYSAYESSGQRSFPDVGPNNAYELNPLPRPDGGPWGTPPGKFEYEETGFFATDTVAFNEKISVLLGVRYGEYENTYADDPASNDRVHAWSPALALMYAPVGNVRSYVTYTRGMQDGGFAKRLAVNAFEPLGVQKSEQWEAGVKGEWIDGRVTGEAAVFQIEQDLATLDADGVDRFDGLQRHRGLEFALRGLVTAQLQAGVAAMLLDAEQVDTSDPALDGKRPQYVPAYQANVWGELAIPRISGLSMIANARFVDGQYLDQAEQFDIDNYWVLDLGGRYRFKANATEWTLRLNVENVLDKRYYESGEFYAGDAGYLGYGAPISATFSVALSF
ncbi:hypothetical protein B1810_07860 [Panacagrimonas perspica]|nr:hypothetical protein B1810_07860 [Panacagrimonas perspica]